MHRSETPLALSNLGAEISRRQFLGRLALGDATLFMGLPCHVAGVSKDMPIIAVTHMPLLTAFYQAAEGTTAPAPKNRVIVNNKEVLALFREHRLVLVLQGHLHVEELLRWQGTTFITGGAVCAKWRRGPWYGTEEGFGVVSLDGYSAGWEYVDYGWEARRPAAG